MQQRASTISNTIGTSTKTRPPPQKQQTGLFQSRMDMRRRFVILGLAALPAARFAQAQNQRQASATKLVAAARKQIGVTTGYDGAYKALDYPNGDIPRATGVCTDVVIRAYRDAFAFDLQQAVHEDMRGHFAAYPAIWGLSRTDRNIDHRRVPNLETFLTRKQALLPDKSEFKAGDLLTFRLPRNLPHIAIVSDKTMPAGHPAHHPQYRPRHS